MASGGRPLRKRIYLSLRPQLQLSEWKCPPRGETHAVVAYRYFCWWSRAELTLESYKSIIALQPVIQIRELPRNLIAAMPSRDSILCACSQDFAPWRFFASLLWFFGDVNRYESEAKKNRARERMFSYFASRSQESFRFRYLRLS